MSFDPHSRKPIGFQLMPDRGHAILIGKTGAEWAPISEPVYIPFHSVSWVSATDAEDHEGFGLDPSKVWTFLVLVDGTQFFVQTAPTRFVNVWG